jgi:hypothetical protein
MLARSARALSVSLPAAATWAISPNQAIVRPELAMRWSRNCVMRRAARRLFQQACSLTARRLSWCSETSDASSTKIRR